MQLREYQIRALDMLYAWFEKNKTGHPVLNMPGGSGKSVVIASLVKDALQNWPDTRILMLVHSKFTAPAGADVPFTSRLLMRGLDQLPNVQNKLDTLICALLTKFMPCQLLRVAFIVS